jgi:hypothetical protein
MQRKRRAGGQVRGLPKTEQSQTLNTSPLVRKKRTWGLVLWKRHLHENNMFSKEENAGNGLRGKKKCFDNAGLRTDHILLLKEK